MEVDGRGRYMKLEKMTFSKKYHIMRILFLIAYIGCMIVLIVESLTPGKQSAKKSNAVGNVIGGFINDLGGDQAKEIDATSCSIKTVDNRRVFSVGESINLNVETLPADSTHKSYTYTTSDSNIATVSKNGTVVFKESGEVVIRATNASQQDIFDEIVITIEDILPNSITSSILNVDMTDNYYILEKSGSYRIDNLLDPDNVTDKKITYTISNTSCISISNDTIYAKNITDDLVTITCKTSNDLESVIYVKVIAKEVVEEKVNLVSINSSNISKYVDQTSAFSPSVSYSPKDTSNEFKGYTLQSLDTDICTVSNNRLYVKGVAGSCTIRITSSYDNSIYKDISLTVKNRSNVSSFDINYSEKMYINNTQRLSVKNVRPYDVSIKSTTYTSSDSSIIEILSNGQIKAKSLGSAIITVTVKDSNNNTLSKDITINVNAKPDYSVDDFVINYVNGEKPVIYINNKTNLKDYFKISKFLNNENQITPESTNYYFSFDEEIATMDGSNITINEDGYGLINGYMYYENSDGSVVYKPISIYALSKFSVTADLRSIAYNLTVGRNMDFTIEDDYESQQYYISINGQSIKLRANNKNFKVTGSDNGTSTITITPIYLDELIDMAKYEMAFNVSDILTTSFDVKIRGVNTDYNNDNVLYVGKTYSSESLVDSDTSKYKVNVIDNGAIDRKYNTFTPKEQGAITMRFIEEYSGLEKEFTFTVRNLIKVENKNFEIKGNYSTTKDHKLEIINGDVLNLTLAFSDDTTYKTINYTSSDEKIVKVYSDGTVEPKKKGEATITLEVNDGDQYIIYTLDVIVYKKNVIENMTSFLYYVRKSVGHFGAFLVLAIFATLTYVMFFRRRLYFVGVGINFLSGFLFAGFTEFLQTRTPGRVGCMSDILIDYSGYITSAIILTIVFTTIFAVKYFRNKKKSVDE